MTVLSKLLGDDWATPFNCYEVAHVWDPNCLTSGYTFSRDIFLKCCLLYSPLFAATHVLLVRKYDLPSIAESGLSVVRSSAFIASHVAMFFSLFCSSRALLGKFYFRVHAFPITFLISYLALKIEKKSRRGPLALYVMNIASECLLRILVDRGLVPSIPHAPEILFTATMAGLLYCIKKEGYGSDPVSFALRLVLGTAEAKIRPSKSKTRLPAITQEDVMKKHLPNELNNNNNNSKVSTPNTRVKPRRNMDINFTDLLPESMKPSCLHDLGKHSSCRHNESCLEYSVNGFIKPFFGAWISSCCMSFAKKAIDVNKLRRDPVSVFTSSFADSKALKFGLFMGSFAGIYKAVNCYLRHRYDGPQDWHGAVGGLIAGPSMLIFPHQTISLYFFWKLVETLFVKAVKKGYVMKPHTLINVIYALSVSQIAYCVILQPKYMRPSYMRLADLVSDHRFHLLNRCFVTFLVPEAIEGYEEYFADLHPDFTSQKFKEAVFPWVLEAKDYCRRR